MHFSPAVRSVFRHLWKNWIRPWVLPLLLITAAKSALADINYVPSGSMQPTILCGDVVFINKLAYDLRIPFTTTRVARWADPARSDVVVCFAPDDGTRLVKRVAALPGDVVELRQDVLWINGVPRSYAPLAKDAFGVSELEPAERDAAIFATERFDQRAHAVMALPALPAERNFGPVTVPPGHYFMLGDNRDNSRDSRFFGFMPREEIIGEVKAVVVSGDNRHWLRPRWGRFFSKLD